MSPGAVLRPLALVVVVAGSVYGIAAGTGVDPDPVLVTLLSALGVVALGLVLDAAGVSGVVWPDEVPRGTGIRGRDHAMSTYLRVVEDHLSARRPTSALRDRLAALADQTLRTRHGLTLESPEGRHLLGPDVVSVLDAPPHRITPQRLEACLTRIEHL